MVGILALCCRLVKGCLSIGIQNTGEYVGLKGSKVWQRRFCQRQTSELDFDYSVDTADMFLQPTSDKAHDDLSNLADDVKGKVRG